MMMARLMMYCYTFSSQFCDLLIKEVTTPIKVMETIFLEGSIMNSSIWRNFVNKRSNAINPGVWKDVCWCGEFVFSCQIGCSLFFTCKTTYSHGLNVKKKNKARYTKHACVFIRAHREKRKEERTGIFQCNKRKTEFPAVGIALSWCSKTTQQALAF